MTANLDRASGLRAYLILIKVAYLTVHSKYQVRTALTQIKISHERKTVESTTISQRVIHGKVRTEVCKMAVGAFVLKPCYVPHIESVKSRSFPMGSYIGSSRELMIELISLPVPPKLYVPMTVTYMPSFEKKYCS